MTDIFWGFEFWFVFFFKRIPWLLSTGNFVSLFLSHSGGVSEPLLYRIPFTGISFSFPEYLQSTQHEPFSVSYFKWCELWNNCEVMKEIVVYTTATQASDPPVLQKTTYMGWSKFSHLRTAFFFLKTNTKWAWRASPALTCTFQSAVDTRLRWFIASKEATYTRKGKKDVFESARLLCAGFSTTPYTQWVLNRTATFKLLAQKPAMSS